MTGWQYCFENAFSLSLYFLRMNREPADSKPVVSFQSMFLQREATIHHSVEWHHLSCFNPHSHKGNDFNQMLQLTPLPYFNPHSRE